MTSDRSSKSHATTWTITLIVALPLLYLLSVVPLIHLHIHLQSVSSPVDISKWLQWYAGPYVWIHNHTPLSYPLEAYELFCASVLPEIR